MRERKTEAFGGIMAVLALVTAAGAFSPTATPHSPAPADSAARARALHVLNRLTFGPRSGDVDRVLALGIDRFIEDQLHPDRVRDRLLEQRLESYEVLRKSPGELARVYGEVVRERLRQRRDTADRSMEDSPQMRRREQMNNPMRRLLGEYQQATVVRDLFSERQLYEVMVDFWANHFNVFIGKGADRFLLPGYIEETIRPRALGTFEGLLLATAQSPAMLFYLDNVQSVAPGSRPPQLDRLQAARGRRPGRLGLGRRVSPERRDSIMNQIESRVPRGINENYAREVMELHTLGVDGGYSQADVVNLARILTGWSISRTRQDPRFAFNEWAHDGGEKEFLGRTFPAGKGMEEGIDALKMLARHPSTMRHVSRKLCARFVSDTPGEGCIDAGVQAWERTAGDIREVVRAIVTSAEFWAPENRGAKTKTPLEFVASALRALGAEPDSTLALAQVVARLGQPLFGQQPPTGYPETQDSWVNAGALLQRMNVALGLASGRIPGTSVKLDAIAPLADGETMLAAVNARLLNGGGSANTLQTMRDQATGLEPEMKRTMMVGLALGSPEFQRQ